jgi:hypothetical protein
VGAAGAGAAAPSFGTQALDALKQAGLNKIKSLGSGQPQPQQSNGGGNFQSLVPSLSPISSAQSSGQSAPSLSPIASAPTNPLAQVTPQVTPGGNMVRGRAANDPDEEARAAGGAPQSSGLL